MDWSVWWDASALAKRYAVEPGTLLVNEIFRRVTRDRMVCLTLAVLEVTSILIRKRNAMHLSVPDCEQALTDLRSEVVHAAHFTKVAAADGLVYSAAPFIERYSVNSTDAIVLCAAINLA